MLIPALNRPLGARWTLPPRPSDCSGGLVLYGQGDKELLNGTFRELFIRQLFLVAEHLVEGRVRLG